MKEEKWSRYSYLQNQYSVLELPANVFFTPEENDLQIRSCQEGLEDSEVKSLRQQLTALIATHVGPRTLNVERLYDRETLSLYEEYKEYYTAEDGTKHYHVIVPNYLSRDNLLLLKAGYISTEFESEFSRVCGINTGDFFVNKITIKWKSADLMKQLIENGAYVSILEDGVVKNKLFNFFGASAGQLRKEMFVLIDQEYIDKYQKVLLCGLDPDVINKIGEENPKKKMNVSKFLAYNSLGMTASERLLNPDGTKFEIRRCIVVPDFEIVMSLKVDNITPDNVVRETKNDIECTACDGQGLIVRRDILPHNIDTAIFRINGGFKGLCSYFPVLEFCKDHDVAPVVKDMWGKEWNIETDHIDIILSASQFKLNKYFNSWEEYCVAFDKYDGHICFLLPNQEEEEETYSDFNYQILQPLMTTTDEDISNLLQYQIKQIKDMSSDKGTMLNCVGADAKSDKARARAIAAYPSLLKLTEFQDDLIDGIKAKIEAAKSSKFMMGKHGCDNKRLFVIKDPYAWCEYMFLGIKNPTGLIPAEHVACKVIANKYDRCALGRSPGLALDEVIAKVIPNNKTVPETKNPYYWFKTDCIYVSIHDYFYLNLNFDMDGDQLNVITDPTYINCLSDTLKFFDFEHCGNYYPGTKAAGNDLNAATFANSILFASQANIGTVSNALTKIWNSKEFVDEVNKKLTGKKYNQSIINDYIKSTKFHLLYSQMNIDAAKNLFIPDLPEETVSLMERTAGSKAHPKKMPHWFRFSKNFKTNEDNRDLNTTQRIKKVAATNDSLCNRVCNYVDEQMYINKVYDAAGRILLDLSWTNGYDYRIFYGDNAGVERDVRVIETWKAECQRFSYSKVKKQCAKDAAISMITTDTIKAKKIMLKLNSLEIDSDVIYYTLVDHLFKDNAFSRSCGSNKYFWLTPLGERAANIIESNIKSGHYSKEGSIIDRYLFHCDKCNNIFTPKSMLFNYNSGDHKGKIYCERCSIEIEKERNEKKHATRDKKVKEINNKLLSEFIENLRRNNVDEKEFFEIIRENNKKFRENNKSTVKITTTIAKNIANELHILEDKNEKYFERNIKI